MDVLICACLLWIAVIIFIGKPININITHTHKVDNPEEVIAEDTKFDEEQEQAIRDISKALQELQEVDDE